MTVDTRKGWKFSSCRCGGRYDGKKGDVRGVVYATKPLWSWSTTCWTLDVEMVMTSCCWERKEKIFSPFHARAEFMAGLCKHDFQYLSTYLPRSYTSFRINLDYETPLCNPELTRYLLLAIEYAHCWLLKAEPSCQVQPTPASSFNTLNIFQL